MEEANEVQEALSRSYGTPEIDDDELEAGPDLVQLFFVTKFSYKLFRSERSGRVKQHQ